MFTNRERAGIDTFVSAVPLYVAEAPKTSIKEHEPPFPIIPFSIVAHSFVGQPTSKQLYMIGVYGKSRKPGMELLMRTYNNVIVKMTSEHNKKKGLYTDDNTSLVCQLHLICLVVVS